MAADLSPPKKVSFGSLYLDPNNPRLGDENGPGYDSPTALLNEETQQRLEAEILRLYPINDLITAILGQGWVPVDPIIVWEHPKKRGACLVVEGNSRTTALRSIRRRHSDARAKLEKFRKRKDIDPEQLSEQKLLVKQYAHVVAATEEITVFPVTARTVKDLKEMLPRLLGVRHITPAHGWGPRATNLYVYSIYKQMFQVAHPNKPLTIDKDLVKRTAEQVSLGPTVARRRIQAAAAFKHFKANYEDRLPENQKFEDEDHYFFENILAVRYASDQFGFKDGDLHLEKDKEDILFKWAFAKPRTRHSAEKNPNILPTPEDIRLWGQIARYDQANRTNFARSLDVADPDNAISMRQIQVEYLNNQGQQSPIDILSSLMKVLKEMPVDVLRSQGSHLRPMLQELGKTSGEYLKLLETAMKKSEPPGPPTHTRR
jgi:hypothetical protein